MGKATRACYNARVIRYCSLVLYYTRQVYRFAMMRRLHRIARLLPSIPSRLSAQVRWLAPLLALVIAVIAINWAVLAAMAAIQSHQVVFGGVVLKVVVEVVRCL